MPVTHIKQRMLTFLGDTAYKDGIMFRPQLVYQHLRIRRGDAHSRSMVIEEAVGRLCPLQRDIRPLSLMESEESAVQPEAFLFEHAYTHFDACIAEPLYPPALYTGERVNAPHHNTFHAFAHDEVGTRRGLAIVCARLKADVNGGFGQPFLIGIIYCGKGIDLGMRLTTTHVPSLSDNSFPCHHHSTHHGIGP